MPVPPKHLRDIYRLFAMVEDEQEARMLLEDILTPQELEAVAERWQLVRELAKGMPQRDVAKDLNLSISKVTRGSRQLKYGSGGFKHFLQKEGQ